MFEQFGAAVQDLSAAIGLLLPGFIFVWIFDLVNRATSRDRPDIQSVMLSLALSLVIYAAVHAIYSELALARDPLDPEFFIGLFMAAAALGYVCGLGVGSDFGRNWLRRMRILIPPEPWIQALSSKKWVVVHLTDETVLYGYPLKYSDKPGENRAVYIIQPQILTESPEGIAYAPLPDAEGVLIDATRISFIEIVSS